MLTIAVIVYSIYFLINLYVSVMQIGFLSQAKSKEAVLMDRTTFTKAGEYAIEKERISIARAFVDYVVVLAWLSGGIAYLNESVLIQSDLVRTIVLVLGFIFINALISLPFSIYEKFVLEQKFGFNKSTPKQYIKDTFIGIVTTAVLGSLVIWGIYLIMSTFTLWWLYSFLFIFAILILINILFPTFRALFFDKLSPLDDKELSTEIQALMDKTGFKSSGVFVSDASKRDSRLNAYFGGIGKTKRVVLFDTLLQKLTKRELLAVLGHELGHFAHGDIYKNLFTMGAMLFAMFAIFGNLPMNLYLELRLSPEPYLIMILFMIFLPVISFIAMPLLGIISRSNEYEADKMGANLVSHTELAAALQKLVKENKSFPLSHPIYIFFHYTHPPVIERLKALGVNINSDTSALEGTCPTLE